MDEVTLKTEYFGVPLYAWISIVLTSIGLIVGIIAVMRRR